MVAASAALAAVGGSLAVASSASAVAIPWGSSSNAPYSGSGAPSSVYSLLNGGYAGLNRADAALNEVHDTNPNVPAATSFPPETGTGALSEVQALSIAADFSGTTVSDGSKSEAPSSALYSTALKAALGSSYATESAAVVSAGESWDQLSSLISELSPFPGTLYSLDSGVTISSKATVTGVGKPTPYSITAATSGSAAAGYVLPHGFTMTFPNDFSVNTALAGAELQPTQEADPTGQSIGTVTLTSPVASEFGGTGTTLTGKVYVVNANNSITQPDLELSFGNGIYELGTFPSTLTFPLTLTFGEASVFGASDPIPFSSINIAFPASTSPVKALNCSNLGSVGGTGTDEVAALAAEFGDTSDGGTVNFASTKTAVTDLCAPTGAVKFAVKRTGPSFSVTLKGNGGTPFTSATISLPSGVSAKGLKTKDLKVTGAKLKSVRGGSKVTVNFKSKTKRATIEFVKGLKISSKLVKSIARHKTKSLTVKFTVKYAPTGAAAATSTPGSVTVKHL